MYFLPNSLFTLYKTQSKYIIMKGSTHLNHMRPAKTNMFFKGLSEPVVVVNKESEEPNNNLEYITSIDKKYNPRQKRIEDTYSRIMSLKDVKNSLNSITTEDIVELCILSPSPFDIAMLLWKLNGQQFRCTDIINQTWERALPDGQWFPDSICLSLLRENIYELLVPLFTAKQNSLNAMLANPLISSEFKSPLQLKLQNVTYIINMLGSITTKNKVIREACELFYYNDILLE